MPAASTQSSMASSGLAVEVLGGEGEPQAPRVVARRVEHDRRQLGVVGPRAAVEVVGADRGPGVVDDAGLGVHVDRGAGVVLDAVDGDPVRAPSEPCRAWPGVGRAAGRSG